MTPANIWVIDLETAPSLGWVWQKWQTDVIDFKSDGYILSFAAKKLGAKESIIKGLCDYPNFKKDKEDDSALVKDLWKIMDEADILIAHNGDSFDMTTANMRFLFHGLKPPTPYKTVDTKKVAKQKFRFTSNKLDELGRYFGLGRKRPTTGFVLWKGCMSGDMKSWRMMKKYNLQDIKLLEKLYYLFLPYITNHPNVNKGEFACPKCGSQKVQKRGFSFTLARKKQRFQCQSEQCGGWFEGPAGK